jgi:hypothetical protein
MIKLITALLLVLAGAVHAQPAAVAEPMPTFPVLAGAACWPEKTPTGWAIVEAETAYGLIAAWWCKDGTWAAIVRAKNPTIDPQERAYLESAVLPLLERIKPVLPLWVVAPNGTATTRPAYRLDSGKLYTSTARATVGDACNCALGRYSTSATTTYCAIPQEITTPPEPLLVAVCRVK